MGVILAIGFLLFAVVFIIPVLGNIDDIAKNGFFCGALGICFIPTEDTEKFKDEVTKQEVEADKVLPPVSDKVVCDLSVKVRAELIDDFGSLKIKMNESNPADYQWFCKFPSPLGWISNLSWYPLAYFLDNEFIHTEIALKDKKNPTLKYDANHPDYKSMYREIRLTDTSGFIATPLNMDQSFYIENVVHGDYILEIYYGRAINNLNAGQPLIDKVCQVGMPNC